MGVTRNGVFAGEKGMGQCTARSIKGIRVFVIGATEVYQDVCISGVHLVEGQGRSVTPGPESIIKNVPDMIRGQSGGAGKGTNAVVEKRKEGREKE